MRLIVAGSRTCDDWELVKTTLDRLTRRLDKKKLVVLSGGAKGADKLGERWAFESMVGYEVYRADWDKYGKAAGMKRNAEMVKAADVLIAFWDGKSPGTEAIIDMAYKQGLKVKVVCFAPGKTRLRAMQAITRKTGE